MTFVKELFHHNCRRGLMRRAFLVENDRDDSKSLAEGILHGLR